MEGLGPGTTVVINKHVVLSACSSQPNEKGDRKSI